MNCCTNCFNDRNIFDFIDNKYVIGDCDFCHSKNEEICNLDELCEHFKFKISSLFNLYDSIYVAHSKFEEIEFDNADYKNDLLTLIQNDWNIFNIGELTENEAFNLLNEFKNYINKQFTPYRNVTMGNLKEKVWFCDRKGFFQKKDWDIFKEIIVHDFRYFPFESRKLDFDLERTLDFKLFSMSTSCLFAGSILYRGRVHAKKVNIPYGKDEMLIPGKDVLSSGRANPIGINYLYLADDIETVLSEVRAWKKGQISIATIEICEDLYIVDFTNKNEFLRHVSAFDMENNILLQHILAYNELMDIFVEEISRPINPNESVNEYVLTQFLSERIKTFYEDNENSTFDGIKFKSSVGNGTNFVLFSDKKVIIKNVDLYEIEDIKVKYTYNLVKHT